MSRDREQDIRETFDTIAPEFDLTRNRVWPEVAEFIDGLNEGSVLLDAGCGNGRHSVYALEKGLEVTAMDISGQMLLVARRHVETEAQHAAPCKFVQGNIERLPFGDGVFDAVVCIAVIHHVRGRRSRIAALTELARVVAPGSELLVSAWAFDQERFREVMERHERGDFSPCDEFGDTLVPWKYGGAGKEEKLRFYHLFVEGELGELCREVGFGRVQEFRSGQNHYAKLLR